MFIQIERGKEQSSSYTKINEIIYSIMLRRAFVFELSEEQIDNDLKCLAMNLKKVCFENEYKLQRKKSKAFYYGKYMPDKKTININLDQKIKGIELYQVLTHEIYHVFTQDRNGKDRWLVPSFIAVENDSKKCGKESKDEKEPSRILNEGIIEKASYSAVFANDFKDNPIEYNGNVRTYESLAFIVEILEAVYGVSEREILKHGIHSKKELMNYLARVSGEHPRNVKEIVDRLEFYVAHICTFSREYIEYVLKDDEVRNDNSAKNAERGFFYLSDMIYNKFNEDIDNIKDCNLEELESEYQRICVGIAKAGAVIRNRYGFIEHNFWEGNMLGEAVFWYNVEYNHEYATTFYKKMNCIRLIILLKRKVMEVSTRGLTKKKLNECILGIQKGNLSDDEIIKMIIDVDPEFKDEYMRCKEDNSDYHADIVVRKNINLACMDLEEFVDEDSDQLIVGNKRIGSEMENLIKIANRDFKNKSIFRK